MRRALGRAALLALGLSAACTPPQAPTPPLGEIPVEKGAAEATPAVRTQLAKAYRDLAQGHTAAAESRFRKLNQAWPELLAPRTGLGYVRLKAGQPAEAMRLFSEVLYVKPDDLDALLGTGEAAVRSNDLGLGVQRYRAAADAHPGDATARKRLADAKLHYTEGRLATARAATAAGDRDAAVSEYRQALLIVPEVAGLRMELAGLLVGAGDTAGAVSTLLGDPTGDPQAQARLGELQMQLGHYEGAVQAYRRGLENDPANADLQRGLTGAQNALDFSRMPEEYRQIFTATFITRADLAALIDVKVTALARAGAAEPKVAVDISGSWAKEHILKTLALDIIDVYPNHTFQPAAMIRRGDLARAVARVLDLLKWPPGQTPAISDMGRSHLYYDAAVRVVASGLMDLSPENAFEPGQRVSGREAANVVEALSRLVGP